MKKTLYVLTAYEAEAKLLLKALDSADMNPVLVRGRQKFTREDEDFQWNIYVSGMGKVRASSTCQMILDFHQRVDRLYEFGLAGGLVDTINIGDLIVISGIYEHDTPNREDVRESQEVLKQKLFKMCGSDISRFSKLLMRCTTTRVVKGRIACGDQDIYSRELRDRIAKQSGAVAVDWESGAIVEVCALNDIPYLGTRIVADKATEEDMMPIPADVWAILDQVTTVYIQTIKSFEKS